MSGIAPLSGESWFRQLVAIPLPASTNMSVLKTRLYDEYRIEVPLNLWNGLKLIRVSIQGYNTWRDVEMLVTALRELVQVSIF
jgi:selenocysteine lyase/cysteine desulfurase